jgi:CheY-like chemotaxis protein
MSLDGARHVLVVDDNDDFRITMRMLLEDAGYIVEEAATGRQALRRLRESRGSKVVLLDVSLPEIDGVQVMEAVARHASLRRRHAYLIVTALEGSLPQTFMDRLHDLGVPIVSKPFNIYHLLDLVKQADSRLP